MKLTYLIPFFAVSFFAHSAHVCGQQQTTLPPTAKQIQKPEKPTPDRVLKPFLWRIEGDTANYIFGTIHVPDPRATKLHPVVDAAFEEAHAAFFEIDFKRGAEQTRAISLSTTERLDDTLSDDLIRRLDQRINRYSPGFRNKFRAKAIIWPMIIPQLEAQSRFPQSQPLDQLLYMRATQSGKSIGGLEDPASQLRELFKLSREEQAQFVRISLDNMDKVEKQKDDLLGKNIDFYLHGDAKAFHDFLMDDVQSLPESLRKKFLEGLLYKRNVRIAREIRELVHAFPNRRHFFAVGTLHMLGDQSVLKELEKAGVKTSRVTEPEK